MRFPVGLASIFLGTVCTVAGTASMSLALDASRHPAASPRPSQPAEVPERIRPLVADRTMDGVWRRADRWAGRPAPVLLTTFRFSRVDTADVAYVAWLRASRTQLALYPGVYGPGPVSLPRGPEEVPPAARSRLLATFNSGFYEQDALGGFFVNGLLYYPMIRGLATVVAYRDGRVDVVRWTQGPHPDHGIVMARQNLVLFVDHRIANPVLRHSPLWGNVPHVWRTGLGIDPMGNLIYLAGPDLDASGLARLLIHAGAVRAMELDINLNWPILVTYGGPGARAPSLFVPNPTQIPGRFLAPSTKDFFALYLRTSSRVLKEPY